MANFDNGSGRNNGNIPQQEYRCVNQGCENGPGYLFTHNHEEWFAERGISAPKNCSDCRDWKRKQKQIGSVTTPCKWCEATVQCSEGRRLMYHRHDGNWDAFWKGARNEQLCTFCVNPHNVRLMYEAKAKREYKLTTQVFALRRLFDDNIDEQCDRGMLKAKQAGFFADVQAIHVNGDPAFYASLTLTGKQRSSHGANELEHIMKANHGHAERLAFDGPDMVVPMLAALALSCDSSVMQCHSGDDLVKVDLATGLIVILTRFPHPNAPANEWRLRTGYVHNRIGDCLESKIADSKWTAA